MDEIDFSQIFHQSSKNHSKGHPPIAPDSDDWPSDWKLTRYKTYPRLPKINLEGLPPSSDFFHLVKSRKSRRNFLDEPLRKHELSILLQFSCGNTSPLISDRSRRAQPSGGATFPIEIYPLILKNADDLHSGLYHYNVAHHALNVLWERDFSQQDLGDLFIYEWVRDAGAVFIMTAVFERTRMKYGERGYRYILQEAGHIGQNMYLCAEALGLKCSALAGTKDENIEKLLDVDGATESLVYAVVLGK